MFKWIYFMENIRLIMQHDRNLRELCHSILLWDVSADLTSVSCRNSRWCPLVCQYTFNYDNISFKHYDNYWRICVGWNSCDLCKSNHCRRLRLSIHAFCNITVVNLASSFVPNISNGVEDASSILLPMHSMLWIRFSTNGVLSRTFLSYSERFWTNLEQEALPLFR